MARPKADRSRSKFKGDGTPPTQMRLSRATLDALDAIAVRENLTYAGSPSRAEAVRWLIIQDQATQARRASRKAKKAGEDREKKS